MMHPIEKAFHDVGYLTRVIDSAALPTVLESLRTVLRMAQTKREFVMIYAPVATDKDFHERLGGWDPEERQAGPQNLTAEQIVALRHFSVGQLVRLETQPQEMRQLAYRDLIIECDRALYLLKD